MELETFRLIMKLTGDVDGLVCGYQNVRLFIVWGLDITVC